MYGRNILNNNHSKKDLVIDVKVKDIQNRVKYIETVLQHFWNRFYAEYTTALRERHKTKTSDQSVLTRNDVDIIR